MSNYHEYKLKISKNKPEGARWLWLINQAEENNTSIKIQLQAGIDLLYDSKMAVIKSRKRKNGKHAGEVATEIIAPDVAPYYEGLEGCRELFAMDFKDFWKAGYRFYCKKKTLWIKSYQEKIHSGGGQAVFIVNWPIYRKDMTPVYQYHHDLLESGANMAVSMEDLAPDDGSYTQPMF